MGIIIFKWSMYRVYDLRSKVGIFLFIEVHGVTMMPLYRLVDWIYTEDWETGITGQQCITDRYPWTR